MPTNLSLGQSAVVRPGAYDNEPYHNCSHYDRNAKIALAELLAFVDRS